ncbi:MAG: TetR/AcrR family transcriptional regulator [Eubacterium sp.]
MKRFLTDKGLRTNEKIIAAAKRHFYEKGYEKMKIKELCDEIGVLPGTFTYYYKTKKDLLKAIYSNLYMYSYVFVGSRLTRKINSIEKNVYTTFIYFEGILKDPRTKKFHLENLRRETITNLMSENFNHVFRQFAKDNKMYIDDSALRILCMADQGMRREITVDFLEGNDESRSVDDFITDIFIFRSRLFKIDEAQMQIYLAHGQAFYDDNPSNAKLLI